MAFLNVCVLGVVYPGNARNGRRHPLTTRCLLFRCRYLARARERREPVA